MKYDVLCIIGAAVPLVVGGSEAAQRLAGSAERPSTARLSDDKKGDDNAPARSDRKDDADVQRNSPGETNGRLTLSATQREALGIRLDTPVPLESAASIDGYAQVLDPVALISAARRIDGTHAAAVAAAADSARLQSLYRDGAQASLKAAQAAQTQAVETETQALVAVASFRQQWGPLAQWSSTQRRALMDELAAGRVQLLRADVPGQQLGGRVGAQAVVEIDGSAFTAQVLGSLPRADAQTQNFGWLLEIDNAPAGLSVGARGLARLRADPGKGTWVPAAALVYTDRGTFVYRQTAPAIPGRFACEPVSVRPLTRIGSGWLVAGLSSTDRIVVEGVGVLWSLQGINSFSAAEGDHD